MTSSPRPSSPRPSPRALAGRTDPSRRVRPVDWSATGALPEGEQSPGQQAQETPTPSTRLPRSGARDARRRAETFELPRPAPSAPEGAVHTIHPEDPHPVPRPLRIVPELIRVVGVEDITAEQLIHAVADPQDAWTADAGASDHFLRDDLVVQVRRVDNTVIGAFTARYALAVRPAVYESALDAALEAAGPSARGGRGTRHPTTRRELISRMEAAGFVITPGSSHGRVSHPEHPGLFVPLASTPSDRRFTRHAVAQIRRVFGIDLRS